MDIQLRFVNGAITNCDTIKDIFQYLYINEKDIEKISFDNPKTKKMIRLLYNDDKKMWIQTPLYYNSSLFQDSLNEELYNNLSKTQKKVVKSLHEQNDLYDSYKEYTKNKFITFLSSF